MLSDALIPSTNSHGSSFGGASRIDFTGQWSPWLFQVIETTDAEPRLHWLMRPRASGAGSHYFVSFHALGTGSVIDLPEATRARLACHFILTQLPDQGLSEALDTLAEMWRFYADRTPGHAELPAPSPMTATLEPPYERPAFSVGEE